MSLTPALVDLLQGDLRVQAAQPSHRFTSLPTWDCINKTGTQLRMALDHENAIEEPWAQNFIGIQLDISSISQGICRGTYNVPHIFALGKVMK